MARRTQWMAVIGLGVVSLCPVARSFAQTGGNAPLVPSAAAATSPTSAREMAAASAPTTALPGTSPVNSPTAAAAPGAPTNRSAISTPATPTTATTSLIASHAGSAGVVSAPAAGGLRVASYTVSPASHDDTALGQRLFHEAVDGSRANPFNWSVHVFKSRHRIEVYYRNQLFKTYHAVFGRSGLDGGKEWEGDSRTPEGAYLIVAKHRSLRFRWFLKLNYPNATDQARFAELHANHQIPRGLREGSLVGIHGTDSPFLNVEDVNWTLGCISVDNSDITEIARLLPVGTLVVINH